MSSSIDIQKKIHVINIKLRQNWTKYDKELKNVVFDKNVISKIVHNCFHKAML
jgi:hypothetical protein